MIKDWRLLFVLSLIAAFIVGELMFAYFPYVFVGIAVFFLFVLGMPFSSWIKNINKPVVFGIDVAIVLILVRAWVM